VLEAQNIHKSYLQGRARLNVLRGASLRAETGEFLVIMGASGSGKSTLLHILGALDVPDGGTVTCDGRRIFELSRRDRSVYRNRHVGFVFQFYHLLPELNVLENVLIPRLVTDSAWRWPSVRGRARRDAEEILERVGLTQRSKHRPRELSGGEMQRVAIGRALINRPRLLLADEPTGNLDATAGEGILELLKGLNEAGQTIVMVTHDVEVASRAHRRVTLSDGTIYQADHAGVRRRPSRRSAREVAP